METDPLHDNASIALNDWIDLMHVISGKFKQIPLLNKYNPYNPLIAILILSLILFFSQELTHTAIADMTKTFYPKISIQEQYEKNTQEMEKEESDWVTLVSPGVSLKLNSPKTSMGLDYGAEFLFYRDDSSKNKTRHQGTGFWEQFFSPSLKLKMLDTFTTSEERILVSENLIKDVFRERQTYYSNNGQIDLSWQFSSMSQMSLGYNNLYLNGKSRNFEDSVSHEAFFNLSSRFRPKLGLDLTLRFNRGQFEQNETFYGNKTRDFYQYEGGLILNYHWQHSCRLYAKYSLLSQDFEELELGHNDDTSDFWLHQGALGVSLPLSPKIECNAEGGYFFQDVKTGHKKDSGTFTINVTARAKNASVRFGGSSGFDQDYFSTENQGSSKFLQVSGSGNYRFTKNTNFSVSASYRWDDFFGDFGETDRKDEQWQTGTGFYVSFLSRFNVSITGIYSELEATDKKDKVWRTDDGYSFYKKDRVWRTSAKFSFSIQRWLILSLEGMHSEQISTDPTYEFREDLVMLRLSGAYPFSF